MMRDHPYLCGYDEVKKHGSSTKLLEKERAWDKAHEPDQPVRGMLAFFQRDPVVKAVDKPSVISQSQRAIIVAGLCVVLFGLSILQNVGMSILLGALGFSVVGLSQRTLMELVKNEWDNTSAKTFTGLTYIVWLSFLTDEWHFRWIVLKRFSR
jgi:hypothetical protein